MLNLFFVLDFYTNGFSPEWLHIFSILAIILAVLTIVNKNPIVSVLFLIGLFVNIAGILFLLGLHFLGLAYILVYVGAVSILFLFILMLINIRISELSTDTENNLPLCSLVIFYFYGILGQGLPVNDFSYLYESLRIYIAGLWKSSDYIINEYSNFLGNVSYASSTNWDNALIEPTHISSIGNIMYTSHSIWLIVTSIILLLGMVGAIMVTIKKK